MTRFRTATAAGTVAIVLAGCTPTALQAQTCQFEYNSKVEEAVVQILKSKFGSTYQFFNYEKPTITRTGNRIELALLPLKTIDGHTIVYESVFIVAVDACSSKIIESFEAKY
ncbi:MAG TPA: hypothetical protein VG819_12170 [Rhizomicrobium sp.]|nr:hypothetical protein [Rhizomicrobium sp.]